MKKSGLIYVASPYYHNNHFVMVERWETTAKACYILLQAGYNVISPILHWHPVKKLGLPFEHVDKRLIEMNIKLLNCCDEIIVLTLNGWQESLGVAEEIEYARINSIPVTYINSAEMFATINKFDKGVKDGYSN